jgi:hypothetical protein
MDCSLLFNGLKGRNNDQRCIAEVIFRPLM